MRNLADRLDLFAEPWKPEAGEIVLSLTAGCLSGEPKCTPPRSQSRADTLSSIMPMEADTGRSLAISSRDIVPGLR